MKRVQQCGRRLRAMGITAAFVILAAAALGVATGLSWYSLSNSSGSTTIKTFCPNPNFSGCSKNVNTQIVIDHSYARDDVLHVATARESIFAVKGACTNIDTYCTDVAPNRCERVKASHSAFQIFSIAAVVIEGLAIAGFIYGPEKLYPWAWTSMAIFATVSIIGALGCLFSIVLENREQLSNCNTLRNLGDGGLGPYVLSSSTPASDGPIFAAMALYASVLLVGLSIAATKIRYSSATVADSYAENLL